MSIIEFHSDQGLYLAGKCAKIKQGNYYLLAGLGLADDITKCRGK